MYATPYTRYTSRTQLCKCTVCLQKSYPGTRSKLPTMCNAVTQTGAASLHGLMTSPASRDTDLRVGVTLVIYLNN